jgi:hypothetical protein
MSRAMKLWGLQRNVNFLTSRPAVSPARRTLSLCMMLRCVSRDVSVTFVADGVSHSESLGLWTSSIVRISEQLANKMDEVHKRSDCDSLRMLDCNFVILSNLYFWIYIHVTWTASVA